MYVPGGSGVERSRLRKPASRRPTRKIARPPKAVVRGPVPEQAGEQDVRSGHAVDLAASTRSRGARTGAAGR